MTRGVRCPMRKVGSRFTNRYGETVTVLEDVDYKCVKFRFDSGTEGIVEYQHLKNLEFYDWMAPRLFGVGFHGAQLNRKGINNDKRIYSRWAAMLSRCYSDSEYNPTYEGAEVCKEWHNFQNFFKWVKSQKHGETKGWHLDKDLLCNGRGKLYSPDCCVMLPAEINTSLHTESRTDAGCKKLGVWYDTKSNRYVAACTWDKTRHVLGRYLTENEAFIKYKEVKEKVVKDLAEKYKDDLDEQAYYALCRWEVIDEGELS